MAMMCSYRGEASVAVIVVITGSVVGIRYYFS